MYVCTVWSFVRNLKDSGIGVANDFTREINKIHKKLYLFLKSENKAKQKVFQKETTIAICHVFFISSLMGIARY